MNSAEDTVCIDSLYRVLSKGYAAYAAEADTLAKREIAMLILVEVVKTLRMHPRFSTGDEYLPLRDLMFFLADLNRGRDHPWSAPVNFGGTNLTTTAQAELKVWIKAAFAVLRGSNFKPVEAYKRIAAGLAANGLRDRKGKSLELRRVQRWCLEPPDGDDLEFSQLLINAWTDYRDQKLALHALRDKHPVTDKHLAGEFVDHCWTLSRFRDPSISGGSKQTA
jgi:hypothetical protein